MRLAQEGADIIALDSCAPVDGIDYPMATHAELETTRELVIKTGRRVHTVVVDVRERQALTEAVETAVRDMGGLDIVVANAGVAALGQWDALDWQQWEAVIGVNLTGTWNTVVASVPHLRARGGGSVVATGSVAGVVGVPFAQAYAASEHGVVGLMRSLSIELADQRIRFNAVCAKGVSGTGMQHALSRLSTVKANDRLTSALLNAFQGDTVEPADVANAVLYLASDEARHVTGTTLSVDAGLVSF
ncbi:SDR family oxidoreductase [Streptomyces sp. NPDC093228]|uniref:SDR family oxidoreductase n=1 Tax=Streptomyces sp. NPDC093228 TaxID=3155070 RepID=UPI003426A0B4